MLLVTSLDALPDVPSSCGLTIGSFDGVHLGHQALLTRLRQALPSGAPLAVLTFSNHPSHYLTPATPVPLIYPPLQKVRYLEEQGVDLVILIPFDATFSQTPYDEFLGALTKTLGCSHLILGSGAVFGKGREGHEVNVRRLAPSLGLQVDYVPKLMLHGHPVSSGRIRALIAAGKFKEAEECLGRPWSLMGRFEGGNLGDLGQGQLQGSQGGNALPAGGLCLPPEGTWPVRIKIGEKIYLGKALVAPKEQRISISSEFRDTSPGDRERDVEIFFS